MATFFDQFWAIDPFAPPSAGTALDINYLEVNDTNNNNKIQQGGTDSIDGVDIVEISKGDTVTYELGGTTYTVTGSTFYLADGRTFFSPTDGTVLEPGSTIISATGQTANGAVNVSEFGPACFVAGTRIRTRDGMQAIETLQPGQKVKTLDAGWQEILWIGHSVVDGRDQHALVEFAPGSIGNKHVLRVSPQHKVLMTGWRAELYCGASEVLVSAQFLVNDDTIRRMPQSVVTYWHVLLPGHHLIQAEGCWSESFFPGDTIMAENPMLEAEINRHIVDMSAFARTARATISRFTAQVMAQPQMAAA